ncbi:hypothetical protein GCM10011487_31180 [Steroidobacter agaridevorans]|uniref:Uncharacterized protein n=1 Tax=Steroidobacter agaridevorans TaxID=2695856 RepID=A0A829YE28_9GAMM|nr:hypothetical protein [Steroidobacter agaridevorans]GFE81118.1 hypothetical protein GCM10011487_31180 [Steroidobacter agaridevorans]GFE88997.1 hypothetical protein GCM10011488_39510 [Steroidobacter agaridevorans]
MSQSAEKPVSAPGSERKSGRAVFDENRTVWEWQTATGVFERHVSDEQLARLENASLQLVEQQRYEGRAIYGETGNQAAYSARKQAFVGRPAPAVRSSSTGTLRQFWRRLLPST